MYVFENLPENSRKNIIKAMITVAIGEEGEDIRNLLNEIGIDEDQKALLWKVIIDQLYSQRNSQVEDGIGHPLPVRQEDVDNTGVEKTLIQIVSELCDQPDRQTQKPLSESELYKLINDNVDTEKSYWNESIERLVEKIVELFSFYSDENKNELPVLTKGSTVVSKIKDLRYADAGNSFEKDLGVKWVRPDQNIDLLKYSGIRNKDKIVEILGNPRKMDRTRNKIEDDEDNTTKSFISLLMPRYGRRVEIEDFDRNFWVIAQIVDGMCSWIFEKSPIPDIIQKMLDETAQLWENILYLWLQLALMSQKKSFENLSLTSSIKIIQSEDLLRYESNPVAFCKREGDNFAIQIPSFNFMGRELINDEEIKENPLKDFEETYSQQDLCFVSRVKLNNYRRNFYEGEWFNQICFSLLNGEDGDKITKRNNFSYEIFEKYENSEGILIERPLVISVGQSNEAIEKNGTRRFTPFLFGACYESGRFLVGYPFSETKNYLVENKREILYCGIRAVPSVKIVRDKNGKKKVDDFIINVYDAIADIFVNKEEERHSRLLGFFKAEEIDGNKIVMKYYRNENLPSINFSSNRELEEVAWADIDFAYYLGECISTKEKTSRITNTEDILEQNSILLKLGNFLPEGVKVSQGTTYSTTPVPAFCMNTLPGKLSSQFRGDFTFYGIPTYFNVSSNENESLIQQNIQIKDDINISRNPLINAFGKTNLLNEIGTLYYYYFDWENYLPEKDIPGNILNTSPRTINSLTDGLCFNLTGANNYFKVPSDRLTEENVLKQGIQVVEKYLSKTRKCLEHPHNELYRQPCSFTTFIGIAPYCASGDDIIKQQINAVCHILRYFPHPDQLKNPEGEQKNYENFYNSPDNPGIEIKDGDIVLGKIIYRNFVDRYDSYYDFYPFEEMVSDTIYDNTNECLRGLFIKNDKNKDYCRRITINSLYDEYKINFTPEFFGTIKYYDFGKANINNALEEVINSENDTYQVSDGKIEVGVDYRQIEDGTICPYDNGKNYYTRSVFDDNGKQTSDKSTGFLHIKKLNKKQYPFDNGAINNKQNSTEETLYGINGGKLYQTVYALNQSNDIPTKENPKPDSQKYYSISEDKLPDWIILVNFMADMSDNNYYKDMNDNTFEFSYCKIVKENSDYNAFLYFYNYLKENFNNSAHSYAASGFQWFSSKDFILEETVNYVNDNPQFTLIDKENNAHYLISKGGEVLIDNQSISYPNNKNTSFNIKYYQDNTHFIISQNKSLNPFKLYFKNRYTDVATTSLPTEKYFYFYSLPDKKVVYFNTKDSTSATELSLKILKLFGIDAIAEYSTKKFGIISGLTWTNTAPPPSGSTITINEEEYVVELADDYNMICNYFGKIIISSNTYEKIFLETSDYDTPSLQKICYVVSKYNANIDNFERLLEMQELPWGELNNKIEFIGAADKKIFTGIRQECSEDYHYVNVEELEAFKQDDNYYFRISPYKAPFDQVYYINS